MGKPPTNKTWTSAPTLADARRMVACYDYAERYDDAKDYAQDVFEARYGAADAPVRPYEWCLYEIDVRTTGAKERWAVAEERYSEEELARLAPHCRCYLCAKPWFVRWPLRPFACPCCIGCISAGPRYAKPENVKQARAALAKTRA